MTRKIILYEGWKVVLNRHSSTEGFTYAKRNTVIAPAHTAINTDIDPFRRQHFETDAGTHTGQDIAPGDV